MLIKQLGSIAPSVGDSEPSQNNTEYHDRAEPSSVTDMDWFREQAGGDVLDILLPLEPE